MEALTVVPGNVVAEQGLENALKLVSLAGRCDIPVAGGAHQPLMQKTYTALYWHGKNGLADIELPAPKCKADPRFGPDLIIELVHKYPHEITLIPVGPLTNIALAVSKDPSIVGLVKNIVIMGGSTEWRKRERRRRSEYFRRSRSRADRVQCRLDGDHGRLRRRRAYLD